MALSRSEQMARIRGKDTVPELLLRRELWRRGYRYRLRGKGLKCRPDLIFPGPKLVVFLDGCFWHGCPDHYVRPRSRGQFWSAKLRENVERDRRQTRFLEDVNWGVLRFWEHEVFQNVQRVVRRIEGELKAHVPQRAAPRVIQATPLPGDEDLERWTLVDLRSDWSSVIDRRLRSTEKW